MRAIRVDYIIILYIQKGKGVNFINAAKGEEEWK